jgi:hypothetical protein
MVCWRGRHLFALSLVASQVALNGCQAQQQSPPGSQPAIPPLVVRSGGEPESVGRSQKPDEPKRPAKGPLDLGPADPGSRDTRAARVRAMVNGEAILDEEVIAAAYQGMVAARTEVEKAEILNAKLNEIIDREVVLQDAIARLKGNGERFLKELKRVASREFDKQWLHRMMRANKYTDAEEFKRFLKNAGMPLDMIRRQWERNFIAMEYLRSRIEPHINKVGHLQMVEYYDKHPEDFRVEDSVNWLDIFITSGTPHPSREAAQQFATGLMGRIRKGEDFVRLAKQYDNGDASIRNAEGIGHKHGEIRPAALEERLFRMRNGEVELIEMEAGFHIVKVVERQYAGQNPFADAKVQKQIKDKLRGEVFQQEMKRIVNDLKRHAIIEVAHEIN